MLQIKRWEIPGIINFQFCGTGGKRQEARGKWQVAGKWHKAKRVDDDIQLAGNKGQGDGGGFLTGPTKQQAASEICNRNGGGVAGMVRIP